MDNFRLSKKKIYEDKRSSIENLHNQKMDDIFDKYNNLEKKKVELSFLEEKIKVLKCKNSNPTLVNNLNKLNDKYNELKNEIREIESGYELTEYI